MAVEGETTFVVRDVGVKFLAKATQMEKTRWQRVEMVGVIGLKSQSWTKVSPNKGVKETERVLIVSDRSNEKLISLIIGG